MVAAELRRAIVLGAAPCGVFGCPCRRAYCNTSYIASDVLATLTLSGAPGLVMNPEEEV